MTPQLCDTSPTTTTTMNLPTQFNLGDTVATSATITAPPEALPQRERFKVNNVTQPFTVYHNQPPPPQVLQQQRTMTSTFRRRQRRRRQQQYCQIGNNNKNNRFAALSDNNNDNDIVDNDVDDNNDDNIDDKPVSMSRNKKAKNKNKKKKRIYLESTRMLRWLEDNFKSSKSAISGRGNQAYVLATGPIYDQRVRDNYEMQV